MGRRFPVLVAILTMAIILPLSAASADPIVIHGSVVISAPYSGATGHLQASGGLLFSDPMFFGTAGGPYQCQPCGPPGTPFSFSAGMDTVDGGGRVEFAGHSYPFGSIGVNDSAVMTLHLIADPVILPPISGVGLVSTRFRLGEDSALFLYDVNGFPTRFSLAGHGAARIELIPNPFLDQLWELGSIRYQFAPVPEPATLLLLGSGVLALCGGARRKRQSNSNRVV